jgi:hypothetical protein
VAVERLRLHGGVKSAEVLEPSAMLGVPQTKRAGIDEEGNNRWPARTENRGFAGGG